MEELVALRERLDALDSQLVALLAERFVLTRAVGEYKLQHGLPAVDPAREAAMHERIREKARDAGLDPDIAERVMRLIIDEVVVLHRGILGEVETA